MKAIITNEALFNEKRVEVSLWSDNVTIDYALNGKHQDETWCGEYGRYTFEPEFGFQIVPNNFESEYKTARNH